RDPAKKCRSRRLPRMSQRDVMHLLSAFGFVYIPVELQNVETFAGAARFHTFRRHQRRNEM
ncbi:MAG TPA: hypothetical protein VF020_11730, partial [Chthoniobacterales bacterium]